MISPTNFAATHRLLWSVLLITVAGCTPMAEGDYTEVANLKVDSAKPQPAESVVDAEAVKSAAPVAAPETDSPPTTPMPLETNKSESDPVKSEKPIEAAPAVGATTDIPAAIKVLVPEKEFSVVGTEMALRVSFDDIDLEKVLDVKTVPMHAPKFFPTWLKELDGKRVRMRGFMYPPFQDTGLRAFTLTRDTSACCFGPNPKVSYLIDTVLRKGESSDYIENRPFDVIGVFHVGDTVEPGKLYTLDDAVVIPK